MGSAPQVYSFQILTLLRPILGLNQSSKARALEAHHRYLLGNNRSINATFQPLSTQGQTDLPLSQMLYTHTTQTHSLINSVNIIPPPVQLSINCHLDFGHINSSTFTNQELHTNRSMVHLDCN